MDESVYVVIHFKKTWTIRDTLCNGFKAQEKMCEHCISWIAGENEKARPQSSWDFVIVEEIVAEGAASECQACERRREALKEKT